MYYFEPPPAPSATFLVSASFVESSFSLVSCLWWEMSSWNGSDVGKEKHDHGNAHKNGMCEFVMSRGNVDQNAQEVRIVWRLILKVEIELLVAPKLLDKLREYPRAARHLLFGQRSISFFNQSNRTIGICLIRFLLIPKRYTTKLTATSSTTSPFDKHDPIVIIASSRRVEAGCVGWLV